MEPDDLERPRWAPRVRQNKIRELYENDARGIYDRALIDDVAWALYARCCSFIAANEAMNGLATCPHCANRIPHNGWKDTLLACDRCGWRLTWAAYFETIQHKQLSGAEPVLRHFSQYTKALPAAKSTRHKVLLIDGLIHGFHWHAKTNRPTRPVAVNLIQGRLREVIALLDNLSYSEMSAPETTQTRTEWNELVQYARKW